jgi:hypothetical protein
MKAQRGGGAEVQFYSFFKLGTKLRVGGQRHFAAALPRDRVLVHIVKEAGWAPGPVSTNAENLAPAAIRSPDRKAHSQSLHRLRHPPPPVHRLVFQSNKIRHEVPKTKSNVT